MTATYTPGVATTRKYLEWAKDWHNLDALSDISKQAIASNITLLLADHARLAEDNAELYTIIDQQARKIAKMGKRLYEHRVKLAKLQNESAKHYSARARLVGDVAKLRAENDTLVHDMAEIYGRTRPVEEFNILKARCEALATACRRQVENIDRWLETGEPAGPEESKSIYEQLKAALRAVEE